MTHAQHHPPFQSSFNFLDFLILLLLTDLDFAILHGEDTRLARHLLHLFHKAGKVRDRSKAMSPQPSLQQPGTWWSWTFNQSNLGRFKVVFLPGVAGACDPAPELLHPAGRGGQGGRGGDHSQLLAPGAHMVIG